MARFAVAAVGSEVVSFLTRRSDVFLIGLFFPTREVGYYLLVQRIVQTLSLVTLATARAISMPVLSRLQLEPARFLETFALMVALVHATWLPVMLAAGILAERLIPMIFGSQWAPAAPILAIFGLIGFSQVFSYFTGSALLAVGRAGVNLRLTLIQLAVTLLVLIPMMPFGLEPVAAAQVFATYLIIVPHFWVLRREFRFSLKALLLRTRAATIAAIGMMVGLVGLDAGPLAVSQGFMPLALLVGAGAIIYVGLVAAIAPKDLRRVCNFVGGAFRGAVV